MNLLKLPAFTSRQKLKEKLIYAIRSEAGFDLS
jgi:ubiquitin-protein ligase E3 C